MAIVTLHDLAPDVRTALERYLAAVDAATRRVDPETADAVAEDLRQHALISLDATATLADIEALTAEIGAPETFAASAAGDTVAVAAVDHDEDAPQGRFLGMPYDFRPPTAERISARWWNPADPRVLMPRVFGMGWTVNFGAAAVRMGIIEPDAEDVPFASVPASTFLWALMVPVALTAAIAGSYLAVRGLLPPQLPSHWGISGRADAFTPQRTDFAWLLALAAVPTLVALWSVAVNRTRSMRAVMIGCATFFSALAVGIWGLTLATVSGAHSAWLLPILLLVVLPLGAVFGVLVALARVGRDAERLRDLHAEHKAGR